MKKFLCVLISLIMGLVFFIEIPEVKAYCVAPDATAIASNPEVSPEALQAQYLNSTTTLTPEDYLRLMYMDPTFNLKAYMYYNEDLMSKYTYSYYLYYKNYLEEGIAKNRVHGFPADDLYNSLCLGRYTTKYQAGGNRGKNLELASSYLSGTVILPGQIFSYNDSVGERSVARGYKSAHIYSGKEVVNGIGGGICQVSSTTYVAMMIAGIPALERHVHSLPVSYLKTNLDATVYWKKLDLKFINPFDFPIVILADTHDGVCTVGIYKYFAEGGNS